jgi:hypothetical protein
MPGSAPGETPVTTYDNTISFASQPISQNAQFLNFIDIVA